MSDTRVEFEVQVDSRTTKLGETVKSTRRTVGAPRVQKDLAVAAHADLRPRSREELEARQEAIALTRRPTKPLDVARAAKNPKTVTVPNMAQTVCGKSSK